LDEPAAAGDQGFQGSKKEVLGVLWWVWWSNLHGKGLGRIWVLIESWRQL